MKDFDWGGGNLVKCPFPCTLHLQTSTLLLLRDEPRISTYHDFHEI